MRSFFVRLFAWAFSLGVIALFSAIGACSSETDTVASPCGGPGACQTRLTLLHTSDIHSRLLPYELVITKVDGDLGLGITGEVKTVGGVSRLAYIINRERARADRALHLDSGDCFQGAPIFNFYAGEPEVRALNAMGLDAAVIGNHEFDRGTINAARQFQRWGGFPLLAANYKTDDPNTSQSTLLGTVLRPFTVFNRGGLKVGVIGMGNLSSLTSIFDQPNRVGVMPLHTVEIAQSYIDLLRPYVDVIVMLTHLGLEVDQRMIRGTTGIDIVLGGHNHIVINPPQSIRDCSADPLNPGFVWAADPNLKFDPSVPPPNDDLHPDPVGHPYMFRRACTPRNVVLAHSGAFAKYLGRLDLVLSNDPSEVGPNGDPSLYNPVDGYEVVSSRYAAFPIDLDVPEDPVVHELLLPYRHALSRVADLDILVGFSPAGARRTAPQGGDSPLGNLVATAMWLRLGVQTDFSLTNTTGVRADLNPGPITIEQMYNIFPFDNSISKMQLSGLEVRDLFDFVARRSAGRGCVAQSQIAGARVRLNCAGCTRDEERPACATDADCGERGTCKDNRCALDACAEQIYIGHNQQECGADADCAGEGPVLPGQCDKGQNQGGRGRCQTPISTTNLYELATSNYLAQGGSGFRVLQRNTTQFDTKIQQRDALIDYLRQGRPCGWSAEAGTPDGLKACTTDADCGDEGDFVCACPGHAREEERGDSLACVTDGACSLDAGRCVRHDCRDQVARFHLRTCEETPNRAMCLTELNPCTLAGEECKFLSCVDARVGNFTDNRLEMIGR